MELIILIVLVYFIVTVIDKGKSSTSSNSNSPGTQSTLNHTDESIEITNHQTYMKVLQQQYEQYGDSMFQDTAIRAFINEYHLSKYGINSNDVKKDLADIMKNNKANIASKEYESYINALEDYYSLHGDNVFLPSKLKEFISTNQLDSKFGIQSDYVAEDFRKIRAGKQVKNEHIMNNTSSVQTQHKQMDNIPSVQTQYKQTNNIPSVQIQHKQEDMAKRTAEYQKYMDSLKQYYVKNKGKVFDFPHIYSFIKEHNLDVRYDIKLYEVFADLMTIGLNFTYKLPCSQDIEDIKFMLRFFKETHGVTIKYNGETCETLLEKGILQVIDFSSTKPPVQEQSQQTQNANNILLGHKQNKQTAIKQTQTVNNILPVQTQSKQIQTINNSVPSKPETLDEYMLIDIVRKMPLWLNSESVNISEYSLVIEMCTRIVKGTIPGIMAGQTLMQYEDIIRQKRLRTSNKAEYDRQIENDIFYELFCYSYLINAFEAVTGKLAPDKLDMILNVDLKNYISLVENECKKRVQKLESEKKHIHSIEVISKKYAQISTQYKMPTLGFINQRENDYIIASLMHRGMISSIAPFFGDDKVEWQFLYIIPAKEFAQTLDIYFSQAISMRLSLYTGDKLFKDLTL